MLTLEIIAEALKHGKQGFFFTLEYTEAEVAERISLIGIRAEQVGDVFKIDCSDDICADYIMAKAQSAEPGTVVAVDYLQLMDQKRTNPSLAEQISALKSFAEDRGLMFVLISQIARTYDSATQPVPGLADIRLPNPLDTALFTKAHFIGSHSAVPETVQ